MLALLAAGQSRRFGDQDKLNALLGSKKLGLHAATTWAEFPFMRKLVIASPDHPCAQGWRDLGYRVIPNRQAEQGQATSVRHAAEQAIEFGATSLCIALADMPFVSPDHIDRLLTGFENLGRQQIVASTSNEQAMPPAIFPQDRLRLLSALDGDKGARAMLSHAHVIAGDEQILLDIDTAEDLAKAEIIHNKNK
ncbi:hypothetical protein A8B75_08370 [Sphingomonadales bacterium EhC05]|nr:hypothetical protein A8B75_08370 [Sphingomonadales bacterium EhC05]